MRLRLGCRFLRGPEASRASSAAVLSLSARRRRRPQVEPARLARLRVPASGGNRAALTARPAAVTVQGLGPPCPAVLPAPARRRPGPAPTTRSLTESDGPSPPESVGLTPGLP